jgi:hypothetical protein
VLQTYWTLRPDSNVLQSRLARVATAQSPPYPAFLLLIVAMPPTLTRFMS